MTRERTRPRPCVARPTRRDILSIGVAAVGSCGWPAGWRSVARADDATPAPHPAGAPGSFGSARSVIFLFLHGGHPQHETWDPKPNAPADVRGEFGSISTAVPGLHFSELFPRCAALADRLTVVRSMSHGNPNHVQACLPAMTGHKHPPGVEGRGDFPPSNSDFPHFGAVLDHLRPGTGALPNWVQIGPVMTRNNGTVLHGQSPGFLGPAHSPLIIDQDLTGDCPEVGAVTPRVGIQRLTSRRELLADIDRQRAELARHAETIKNAYYQRAYNLLTSSRTRDAFDLGREPAASRARYPGTPFGQSCLLARRLVEAGVPFVNVHYCRTPQGSWDTHSQNFRQMRDSLAPNLDGAFSALLVDLEERGLLDQVLVMPMGEFGRTPQINKSAGRDHWPFVYSLAFAGAGLRRGIVVGQSDRLGAYPLSTPFDPSDMAATMYHLLGVPADTVLQDRQPRPHRLIVGTPIADILS
ncbi:MAG: DUF1501 domain-containing protein [Pirellulaceae bacterium]